MSWKRISLGIGVFVAAAVSATAIQAAPATRAQTAPAFVQWSVNGSLVGDRQAAPDNARDFHAAWTTGGAVLVWTKNGATNSGAISSPSGVNDIRVVWGRTAAKFTAAFWTHNGVDVQSIPIASGSNGLYLRLGSDVFSSAFWSRRGGGMLQPITPAPGANDVHLELGSA